MKRNMKVINLDPAAEKFGYNCDIDIRELISVNDVMQKLKFGPNGALVYCMEYLMKNMNWLEDAMNDFGDNTYFLIDCPGQLELYSHYNIIKTLTNHLKRSGINILSVFCLDSTFITEQSKFVSGCVLSLATMIQMELPHLTVLTKTDMVENKDLLEQMEELDPKTLINEINPLMGKNMEKLNKALIGLIDSYSLVDIYPLNITDEDSMNAILYQADNILQYYDNQEPQDKYYNDNIDDNN
jgi:GTPase SAR1 family protein